MMRWPPLLTIPCMTQTWTWARAPLNPHQVFGDDITVSPSSDVQFCPVAAWNITGTHISQGHILSLMARLLWRQMGPWSQLRLSSRCSNWHCLLHATQARQASRSTASEGHSASLVHALSSNGSIIGHQTTSGAGRDHYPLCLHEGDLATHIAIQHWYNHPTQTRKRDYLSRCSQLHVLRCCCLHHRWRFSLQSTWQCPHQCTLTWDSLPFYVPWHLFSQPKSHE